MEFYSKEMKKVKICRVLLRDNTWSKYRVDRFSNEGAITFKTKKHRNLLWMKKMCTTRKKLIPLVPWKVI